MRHTMNAQTDRYALLEAGSVHTKDLSLADANEMIERHSRIFDTVEWLVVPMSQICKQPEMEGFLERHRRLATTYSDL